MTSTVTTIKALGVSFLDGLYLSHHFHVCHVCREKKTMMRLAVLVLLSLLAVCFTMTTYSLYDVDSWCDEPYGTVLGTVTADSRMFCTVLCRQTPSCQTAVFNSDVNTCTMNNDTMSSAGNTSCGQLVSFVSYMPVRPFFYFLFLGFLLDISKVGGGKTRVMCLLYITVLS